MSEGKTKNILLFKNRKALSTIIATLLLITLTLVVVGVVWVVVNNIIKEKIGGTEACFNIFEKVQIGDFTCYNSTSAELRIAISVKDISMDSLLVSVTGDEMGKTFTLKNNMASEFIKEYKGVYNASLTIPGQNSGITYVFNMTNAGFSGAPKLIKISPEIKGKQCDVIDTLEEIPDCRILAV